MAISRAGGGFGPPGTSAGLILPTTFSTVENPISQGGVWVHGGTDGLDWHNCKSTGGRVVGTSTMGANPPDRYADNLAHLKTSYRTFAANQYVETIVGIDSGYIPITGKHESEHLLRFSISGHDAHGYEVMWGIDGSVGYLAVVKWNGALGDFTTIYDPGANLTVPTDGAVLRSEITGTSLVVKRNGTTIVTVDLTKDQGGGTISTWSSGQPGLGFWPADGAVPASYGWKSWTAGDL